MRYRDLRGALAASVAIYAVAVATPAMAQTKSFDVPEQSAATGIPQLATQADVQILVSEEAVRGKTIRAIKGSMSVDQAIRRAAADAGLRIVSSDGRTWALAAANTGNAATPAADDTGYVRDEIVVTAQKRVEAAQDVPIAISVLSQKNLEEQKIESGADIMRAVPNLTFSKSNFTSYNISIRGIGTKAVSATSDPGVAVSFNNVGIIHNRFFEQEFFDMERMEVLRGPQGTLYGRNATGGVINLITAKPKLGGFEGNIKGEVGNYNSRRLHAVVGIGLYHVHLSAPVSGACDGRGRHDAFDPSAAARLRGVRRHMGCGPLSEGRCRAVAETARAGDGRRHHGPVAAGFLGRRGGGFHGDLGRDEHHVLGHLDDLDVAERRRCAGSRRQPDGRRDPGVDPAGSGRGRVAAGRAFHPGDLYRQPGFGRSRDPFDRQRPQDAENQGRFRMTISFDRRALMTLTGAAVLVAGSRLTLSEAEAQTMADEWDKTFPKNAKVDHQKVAFKNRYGIMLAGDLYWPKGRGDGRLAAIAVGGPFGAVKEQSSGLYAQTMAERGFVTLAFDASYTGESGGEPRNVASPDINTEDFSAAVDFLGLHPSVDRERIGIIGICGWGGMALNAVAVDKRVKAVATSTMYDMTRVMSKGYDDGMTPEQRTRTLEQLSRQRWADAENGHPAYQPPYNVLHGGEAPFLVDYHDYYMTPRGYHSRAVNSGNAWTQTTPLAFMNMPLLTYIKEIAPRPVLLIHGEKAHSRYFSETAYAAAAEPKELMIVPGASHVDLYDRTDLIPFGTLQAFFERHLA